MEVLENNLFILYTTLRRKEESEKEKNKNHFEFFFRTERALFNSSKRRLKKTLEIKISGLQWNKRRDFAFCGILYAILLDLLSLVGSIIKTLIHCGLNEIEMREFCSLRSPLRKLCVFLILVSHFFKTLINCIGKASTEPDTSFIGIS